MAVFRHVVQGSSPGEIWSFTLHTDSALDVDAAQSAWTAGITTLFSDGTPPLTNSIASTIVAEQTSTALLSASTGAQVTRRISAIDIPGTSVEEQLPFQVALAVSTRTDLATRSGRGRFYLPPLVATLLDEGRLPAANVTVIADRAASFFGSLNSGGLTPVVYHRSSLSFTPINAIDVGNVYDTQRRRRNSLVEVRESRAV